MSEISSFRFWCQKVLPAVYDDSLSYYELLCKVVAKLNEVIKSQNGTNDNVSELARQFEQLKNDLQSTIESEAEKIVDNYVKTNNLVKSINGIAAVGESGEVTLQASDVGAIANVNGSVKENNIQDGAVTADKLAPSAVPVKSVNGKTGKVQITATEIDALPNTAGSVRTSNLQDGAVTGNKIATGAVVSSKIANQAVQTGNIADNAISAFKIANGAVSSAKIAAGAVGTDKIGNGAVTRDKLSDNAVPVKSVNTKTGEVVLNADDVKAIPNTNGAVTTANIRDENVTTAKIKNGNVTYAKIADEAIAESKIRNAAISTNKIADYAVTNPKIATGTITPDRLADQGVENAGKLLKIGADGKPAWLSGAGAVTAGVESVNGKDGAVTLGASDVGAVPAAKQGVRGEYFQTYYTSETIAAVRQILSKPTGSITLYWPGHPAITISENNEVSISGAPVSIQSRSVGGMSIYDVEHLAIDGVTLGKMIVGGKTGLKIVDAVTSVNSKTGAVTLNVDDIQGALKEVAPSNVLTGDTVDGAFLLLAPPQNAGTDTFQKTDKLPLKMLPTNIDGSLLKDGTVGTRKLIGLSVTTEKINNGAVTQAKMATNSVSTACVQDGAVTLTKLNQPGTSESGKVLGVSSTGQWELQTPSGGEWEEIPATSLIQGATVHCRIQPGTGWLWFSIESDASITLATAGTSSSSYATRLWGTINFNACNRPVPPNGTSSSSDQYTINNTSLVVSSTTTGTINSTSVQKITNVSVSSGVVPVLSVSKNNTGITSFGLRNVSTTAVTGKYASFYVPLWFDNRGVKAAEATNEADATQE